MGDQVDRGGLTISAGDANDAQLRRWAIKEPGSGLGQRPSRIWRRYHGHVRLPYLRLPESLSIRLHKQGGRTSLKRVCQVAMAIGFVAGDGHKEGAGNHSPAIVADRRYRARSAGDDRSVSQVSKPRRGFGGGAGCSHESAAIIAASIGSNSEPGLIRVSPNTATPIDRQFT